MGYLWSLDEPCCGCTRPAGDALVEDPCRREGLASRFLIIEARGADRYVGVAGCPSLSWPQRFLLETGDGAVWRRRSAGAARAEAITDRVPEGWLVRAITLTDGDHRLRFVERDGKLWFDRGSACGDCQTTVRVWLVNTARILPEADYREHTLQLTGTGMATLPAAQFFDCGVYNYVWTLHYSHDAIIWDGWLTSGAWVSRDRHGAHASLAWDLEGRASVIVVAHHRAYNGLAVRRRSACVVGHDASAGGVWPHGFELHQHWPTQRNPCVDLGWCDCGGYRLSVSG